MSQADACAIQRNFSFFILHFSFSISSVGKMFLLSGSIEEVQLNFAFKDLFTHFHNSVIRFFEPGSED